MSMEKERTIKKQCFLCYNFTLSEFTEETIKTCAENWLDAENCPNYIPLNIHYKKIIITKKEVKNIVKRENSRISPFR